MRQRMRQRRSQHIRRRGPHRRDQQRIVLKRLPIMIEDGQHTQRPGPQPLRQQRPHLLRRRPIARHRVIVIRHGRDQAVIGHRARPVGHKQARRPKPQWPLGKLSRRHPGRLRHRQTLVLAHSLQLLAPPAKKRRIRRIPNIFNRQPQMNRRTPPAAAWSARRSEKASRHPQEKPALPPSDTTERSQTRAARSIPG